MYHSRFYRVMQISFLQWNIPTNTYIFKNTLDEYYYKNLELWRFSDLIIHDLMLSERRLFNNTILM